MLGDYLCTSPVSAAVSARSLGGVRRAVWSAVRHGRPGPFALAYAALNAARIVVRLAGSAHPPMTVDQGRLAPEERRALLYGPIYRILGTPVVAAAGPREHRDHRARNRRGRIRAGVPGRDDRAAFPLR